MNNKSTGNKLENIEKIFKTDTRYKNKISKIVNNLVIENNNNSIYSNQTSIENISNSNNNSLPNISTQKKNYIYYLSMIIANNIDHKKNLFTIYQVLKDKYGEEKVQKLFIEKKYLKNNVKSDYNYFKDGNKLMLITGKNKIYVASDINPFVNIQNLINELENKNTKNINNFVTKIIINNNNFGEVNYTKLTKNLLNNLSKTK